jgi:hypothetical protein
MGGCTTTRKREPASVALSDLKAPHRRTATKSRYNERPCDLVAKYPEARKDAEERKGLGANFFP